MKLVNKKEFLKMHGRYEIDKNNEPFYESKILSREYYQELILSIGEPQNEEVKKVLSEIANKLAELSLKYNVVFRMVIRKSNN